MWKHALLERKYEKHCLLMKKITMGKNARFKITVGESRMMYVTNHDNVASISSEWVRAIPIYFDVIKPGQVKYLRSSDSLDKEKVRRNYNTRAINNLFYSATIKTHA